MANRQTLRNFFSLYNKQCVRMELQFNDGTSTVYSDPMFINDIIDGVRAGLAKDIQASYCREPKAKKEDKK